jgi:hypothetical protein
MSFMNLFTKTQESYSTVACGELEQIIAQEGIKYSVD